MSSGHSAADVLKFLDYLVEKGLGKPETMKGRKIAFGKIVEAVGDSEFQDVRDINVDEIMSRFSNLEGNRFTPDSLRTYKSRFATAIQDFARYKADPAAFHVQGQRSARRKVADSQSATPKGSQREQELDQGRTGNSPTLQRLDLPIPIRADAIVRISGLPHDLRQVEAQRISNVIMAMAIIEE